MRSSKTSILHFSNVTKQYANGHLALRNVNFILNSEQLVFLTGHSGAGKTSVIRLITREEQPTQGHVFVNGQNLSTLSHRATALYRRTIGVVHQDHKLLDDRTVRENVALPLLIANMRMAKIQRQISASLEMVGLEGTEAAFPRQLSGGEQQRVGIARAIVGRPRLILADEPTGNLDANLSDDIMDIFRNLVHYRTTILIATHEYRHFRNRTSPVLELENGSLSPASLGR